MNERMIFVGSKKSKKVTEQDVRDYLDKLRSGEETWTPTLEGGKGKGKTPLDFDEDAVVKGALVELEHTTSLPLALEIVVDHLAEGDPEYYDKLELIHNEAKRRAALRNQINEGLVQKGIEALAGIRDRLALALKELIARLGGPGKGGAVGVETPEQVLRVLITRMGLKNALERLAKAAPAVTQALIKVAQEAGHKVTTLADAIAALGERNVEQMLGGAMAESVEKKHPVDTVVDSLLETGEMSASELEPGGDWYGAATGLKAAALEILDILGLPAENFEGVHPFDQYQGPYASLIVTGNNRLWLTENPHEYMLDGSPEGPIVGTPEEIAMEAKEKYAPLPRSEGPAPEMFEGAVAGLLQGTRLGKPALRAPKSAGTSNRG